MMTGIIILNYNNSFQTLECLESLHKYCRKENYKVCVVDNASSPEDRQALEKGCGAHLIVAESNGGYARGNNLGCEYFSSLPEIDSILILNNDTRLTEDIVTPMQNYLAAHPECGVVFPLVVAPDGSIDKACLRKMKSSCNLVLQATSLARLKSEKGEFIPYDTVKGCTQYRTEVPPGSCMMLRKETFRKIGWFDSNTFLYYEEHILACKLMREHLQCMLLPQIKIIHLGAATTRKQPSKTIYSHWRNSYLYFVRRYSSVPRIMHPLLRFRTRLALIVK